MTFNKLIRFIVIESHFRLRAIIFVVFAMVTILQFRTLQLQAKQLGQIKTEKKIVMQIPDMEKKIKANTIRTMTGTGPQVQIAKIEFVLRGTSIRGGIPYALIGNTVYKEGDSIGDYTVIRITKDSAILENKLTGEVKNLYFKK